MKSSLRRGFTLIELLVVIAIIAILASLLLPALSLAKAQAVQAYCISNHKQLSITWFLYQDDFNNALPANVRGTPPLGFPVNWVESTVHGATPAFIDTNALTDPRRAAFARYIKTHTVYRCPAERTVYRVGTRRLLKLRSYSMNDYLNGGVETYAPVAPVTFYKKSSDFRKPANLFVFLDVEPLSICFTPFEIPTSDTEQFFSAPGALHARRKGVITFADGHVEAHRWKRPILRKVPEMPAGRPHPSGGDRQDIGYLRGRAHHLLSP